MDWGRSSSPRFTASITTQSGGAQGLETDAERPADERSAPVAAHRIRRADAAHGSRGELADGERHARCVLLDRLDLMTVEELHVGQSVHRLSQEGLDLGLVDTWVSPHPWAPVES